MAGYRDRRRSGARPRRSRAFESRHPRAREEDVSDWPFGQRRLLTRVQRRHLTLLSQLAGLCSLCFFSSAAGSPPLLARRRGGVRVEGAKRGHWDRRRRFLVNLRNGASRFARCPRSALARCARESVSQRASCAAQRRAKRRAGQIREPRGKMMPGPRSGFLAGCLPRAAGLIGRCGTGRRRSAAAACRRLDVVCCWQVVVVYVCARSSSVLAFLVLGCVVCNLAIP